MRNSIKEMIDEIMRNFSFTKIPQRIFFESFVKSLPESDFKRTLMEILRISELISFEKNSDYHDFKIILITFYYGGYANYEKNPLHKQHSPKIRFFEKKSNSKNIILLLNLFYDTGVAVRIKFETQMIINRFFLDLDFTSSVPSEKILLESI